MVYSYVIEDNEGATSMTLPEIKQAIEDGNKVYWTHEGYEVVKNTADRYSINCTINGSCIGLTWTDGVTMNGGESDFFVLKPCRECGEEFKANYRLGHYCDKCTYGYVAETKLDASAQLALATDKFIKDHISVIHIGD